MQSIRNSYDFLDNKRTCYTFYRNPEAGDTFKHRESPSKMIENPKSFLANMTQETLIGSEKIQKISDIKPNETKTYTKRYTLEKVRKIASQLFAPCPCEEHIKFNCFKESKNFCDTPFAADCIGEMGFLKQDALRKRLNEIQTSKERNRYILNNFNGFAFFNVKE